MSSTRKEFLIAMAGAAALLPQLGAEPATPGKLLIVVAHPDDEYAFAASTYRLVRELGWTADQVVITDGESGYRYAALAETYYGVPLMEGDGRTQLASIRKQEVQRAGKVLGIRHHYFLDQKDLGFATDASSAGTANWNRPHLLNFLSTLLHRERYDVVLTLLPTAQTHGHHRAATLLTEEAVSHLPEEQRPLVFGVESREKSDPPLSFEGHAPALTFDRAASFGYRNALSYRIVVNWVIAEHKSQGLFQNDYSKHELEEFWLFEVSGKSARERLPRFESLFRSDVVHQGLVLAPADPNRVHLLQQVSQGGAV